DDPGLLPELVGAGLAYLPAAWVTIGVGAALFGLLPRASAATWLVIVYAVVVGMFGELLSLPSWTRRLSPFGHIPMLPAEHMDWAPLVVLTLLAAGLVAAGLVGFRRRDLETKSPVAGRDICPRPVVGAPGTITAWTRTA